MVAIFQMFPCTSLMNTGCPGSRSIPDWVEVLGCLLMSSWHILEPSTVFPIDMRGFVEVKSLVFILWWASDWWQDGTGNRSNSILQQSIVPWFPIFDSFFHQLLYNAHKSLGESIVPWMMWAAHDMVHLIELKELLELLETVARSIVASQHEWLAKFSKDHSEFFDHKHVWNCSEVFAYNDEFGEVVTNHKEVNLVPVEQIWCLRCAMGLVELCWHSLRAWLLWNSPGMYYIFLQLHRCHHLFQSRIQTPGPSAYISRLLGCPLSICYKAFLHSMEGMRILWPLVAMPSSMDMSSQ